MGKFELDNLVSEKRFLFLSTNGGVYQSYHFLPAGDANDFGLGDNQIGAELSGHSQNSYTRYGVALLSTSSGNPGLVSSNAYDTYLTFSHAIDAGKLGVERLGVYAYLGRRPTYFQTTDSGAAIPGTQKNLGDVDAFSGGVRWYPIMFSRAGLSWHTEISAVRMQGSVFAGSDRVWATSVFSGLDFDF